MKSTGMTRHIDELGRIVIPKEIRKALELNTKDPVEFFVEDGNITLRKPENVCVLCGNREDLKSFEGKSICSACIDGINKML